MRLIAALVATGAVAGVLVVPLAAHAPFTSSASAAGADGKSVYATRCAACHGTVGQGAERAGPPLAHNWYVTGDARKVIHTVAAGMKGPISFNGKSWGNGVMPASKNTLTNGQIAAVVTYIRGSWGNRASPVSEAQVVSNK
jgi:mono/diheme cytochrome c family protein